MFGAEKRVKEQSMSWPVFKSGERQHMNKYSTISSLCNLTKLFEIIFYISDQPGDTWCTHSE